MKTKKQTKKVATSPLPKRQVLAAYQAGGIEAARRKADALGTIPSRWLRWCKEGLFGKDGPKAADLLKPAPKPKAKRTPPKPKAPAQEAQAVAA
jgi:hypothetical protein